MHQSLLLFYFFWIKFNIPFQDFFTHIETSQSVGGAKRVYPRKTTRHTRKQNLACLTCGQCGALTYTSHSEKSLLYPPHSHLPGWEGIVTFQFSEPCTCGNKLMVTILLLAPPPQQKICMGPNIKTLLFPCTAWTVKK